MKTTIILAILILAALCLPPAAAASDTQSRARRLPVNLSPATIARAMQELGIDDYADVKLRDRKLRFVLHNGDVLFWPPEPGDTPPGGKP